MRFGRRLNILLLGTCATAFAQQYIITTYAGNGTLGYSGDGGPATKAQLAPAEGPSLAVDSAGNLYIAEFNITADSQFVNNRVRKVSPTGVITTVAGTGSPGYSGDGGLATSAKLAKPQGLATDSAGNLYISDNGSIVRKVSPTGIITTVAGTGVQGYSGDGGLAINAQLNDPVGLAVDASDNLYIADSGDFRVRRVTSEGVISTVAGTGVAGQPGLGNSSAEVRATSVRLNYLAGLASDKTGNLFIAAQGDNATLRVSPGGAIAQVYKGTINAWPPGYGEPTVWGIATDSNGNLYAADSGFMTWMDTTNMPRVQVTGSTSSVYRLSNFHSCYVPSADSICADLTVIAGQPGDSGYSGDTGLATRALLGGGVFGLAVENSGKIYVNDYGNHVIRLLTPITTLSIAGPAVLPAGTVGVSYAQSLSATGGVPPYIWTLVSGSLPAGLALSVSGQISGTPNSAGTTAFTVRVTDSQSVSATQNLSLTIAAPGPSITSGGVVNGASFLPGIAPGAWVSIRGTNLSSTTRIWNDADFSGSSLPTKLDDVSATVNGKPAYVYFISPTQLNVLAPDDSAQGSVAVQVTTAQGQSNVASAFEAAFSPALFTFSQQGGKYVAAVRSDGAYIAPANLISGLTTVPAVPGDTILLFGTGFGPTIPANPTGQLVNSAPLANQIAVRIGGVPASAQYAGLVGAGLYQFNVVVPNVQNGDNEVTLEIGGSSSQPNAFLTIQK